MECERQVKVEENVGESGEVKKEKKKLTKEEEKRLRAERRKKKLEDGESRLKFISNPSQKLEYKESEQDKQNPAPNSFQEETLTSTKGSEPPEREEQTKEQKKENEDTKFFQSFDSYKLYFYYVCALLILVLILVKVISYGLLSLVFVFILTEGSFLVLSLQRTNKGELDRSFLLLNVLPNLIGSILAFRDICLLFIFTLVVIDSVFYSN